MESKFKFLMQKRILYNQERYCVTKLEVEKLLKVEYITEEYFLDWLANVVLVRKANG